MEDVSASFAWGVFLVCLGGFASIIFVIIRVLIGQLVRMAGRLQPTAGIVRERTGFLINLVSQILGPAYRAPCRYEYEVGGKQYSGTLLTLQVVNSAKAAARDALAAHQPGDAITVLYDTARPSRSVIDGRPPTLLAWVRVGSVIAGVAVVAGVVLIVLGYR